MLLQAIKFYVVPEIFIPYPRRVILENDEAKLEFLEGWVGGREGGFQTKKTSHGEVWIFFGTIPFILGIIFAPKSCVANG